MGIDRAKGLVIMKKRSLIPALVFMALALITTPALLSRISAGEPVAPVYYIKAEGIVNPVMAEFISKGLKDAAADGAAVLVIQLDTPGGLDLSMRDIIKDMLSSTVPVAVYVAPAGSRAASAGVFITYAADVASMAPGTNIGSAHPVAMGGEKMDETMARKVENDAVAYIRGIAGKRGRNADWAEKAVRSSVNITAEEALKLKVIDFMARDRGELLTLLDGVRADTVMGERVIRTKGAEVKDVAMNWRFRVLGAISNPNVAYILMIIGLLGLYFELSNPGVVLPGVIGALCLVLAFYAFQTLPINYAGLLLIGLAVIFFIVEIKVVSYGLLTIAGIVSLVLGSLMLFDSPLPFMRISLWVVLPAVVFMSLMVLLTMYYAMAVHRRRPVSGPEGIIGSEGVAAEDIPGGEGQAAQGKVFVDGEYWNAVSDAPVKKGDGVRVAEVRGLLLKVTRV
jgi:membrane-bound serine protease (ClpP class)